MNIDSKTKAILKFLKSKKVGVFCDNANLYHAYQKYGWRVDFGKFKKLISQYSDLQFINYYLVIPAKNDIVYYGTQRFLEKIEPFFVAMKRIWLGNCGNVGMSILIELKKKWL